MIDSWNSSCCKHEYPRSNSRQSMTWLEHAKTLQIFAETSSQCAPQSADDLVFSCIRERYASTGQIYCQNDTYRYQKLKASSAVINLFKPIKKTPHAMPTKFPPPPVCTRGYWQRRQDFQGNKSFGYFICHSCNKQRGWISAHAFRNYKQGCQKCEKYTLPTYLWVNLDNNNRSRSPQAKEVPHDYTRCNACKAGVCQAEMRWSCLLEQTFLIIIKRKRFTGLVTFVLVDVTSFVKRHEWRVESRRSCDLVYNMPWSWFRTLVQKSQIPWIQAREKHMKDFQFWTLREASGPWSRFCDPIRAQEFVDKYSPIHEVARF